MIESKLPGVSTTIFTVMSKLAADHGAINLSQGYPDFDGPPELLARVTYYLNHGFNQYAPMPGVPALREQIAAKVADHYGATVDPETEVTVAAGATVAIFCAVMATVHPGDEVILFDPAYDSYEPAVRLAGGVARHIPLKVPAFTPDWDRVRDTMTARTRMIIINTPHNPTGAVWNAADIAALTDLARSYDFYLVADEVYEHIIFDGRRHESLLRYPELYARSFVVSSFGKTFHTTGWKMGYCVAPPELTAEYRRIHQYVTFVVNNPLQLGIADFMREVPEHAKQLPAFYQAKRDKFCEVIGNSRFTFEPAAGTYFQVVDYGAVSNDPDTRMAERMTIEHGVASIPLSPFYAQAPEQTLLRFCFCKDDATLSRAGEILCRL